MLFCYFVGFCLKSIVFITFAVVKKIKELNHGTRQKYKGK